MANKMVELEKEDLEVIKSIAEKYDITLRELGKSLTSRKYPRLQIVLTVDELKHIDDNAKRLNLSRSMYCYQCFKKAIDEKIYENMNILEVVKKNTKGMRSERVAVSFTEGSDYEKIEKFANDLGVASSGIIRYFALTVEL